MGLIFPVLLMMGQYLQIDALQKLKPLSFVADLCLLLLGRPVSAGVDGPGSGAPSGLEEEIGDRLLSVSL